MPGLAARRGAGVQHALARREIKQVSRILRPLILYRHDTISEARQTVNRDRMRENDCVNFAERCADSGIR